MKIKNFILLSLLAYFTFLMLRLTIPYLSFRTDVSFLRIKQWMIHNQVWKTAFFTHVISSCFCLVAGFTQFSNIILKKYRVIHRYMGWLYIVSILGFSAPSGLIMGIYANGGITSQIAFVTLSILWIIATLIAFCSVIQKNYSVHQKFMVRSYALTLSAITLRIWKLLIVLIFRPHPMDAYTIVAWLGWLPNLLYLSEMKMSFFNKVEICTNKRG